MAPVLKLIIDDLVTAATEGIRDVDFDGRPICVLIDTVAMIGDLAHAVPFTNVPKHSANELCTHCCGRKYKIHTFP